MSEMTKYGAYKKRLQGVCEENNLVSRFSRDAYPFSLTIRPVSELNPQMSLLEEEDGAGGTSQDAYILFAYKDGALVYRTSETFTISDALFSKIKNLYKNMYFLYLQFFYREIVEKKLLVALPEIDDGDDTADKADKADMPDMRDMPDMQSAADDMADNIDDDTNMAGDAAPGDAAYDAADGETDVADDEADVADNETD